MNKEEPLTLKELLKLIAYESRAQAVEESIVKIKSEDLFELTKADLLKIANMRIALHLI